MKNIYNDTEYLKIVQDILNNNKFKELINEKHHGLNRMDHSLKVSYYSYRITKKLHLNYIETARGGLLHDFFLKKDLSKTKRKLSMFFHPYYSLNNSNKLFNLTNLEKDIIINHMFPTLPHKIPKYLESWIVSIVDKQIATFEFYYSYGKPFIYKYANIYVIIMLISKCL